MARQARPKGKARRLKSRFREAAEAVAGKQSAYVNVINFLTSEADDIDPRVRLKEAAAKNVKELLSDLGEFENVAGQMRMHLRRKLEQFTS